MTAQRGTSAFLFSPLLTFFHIFAGLPTWQNKLRRRAGRGCRIIRQGPHLAPTKPFMPALE